MKNIKEEISFEEFGVFTKELWIKAVTRELKDSPLSALDIKAGNSALSPIYIKGEGPDIEVSDGKSDNDWLIAESFRYTNDPVGLNLGIMEALNGGTEALILENIDHTGLNALDAILHDVDLRFLHTAFQCSSGKKYPDIISILKGLINSRGWNPEEVNGIIHSDPAIEEGDVINARNDLPGFRFIGIHCPEGLQIIDQLVFIAKALVDVIEKYDKVPLRQLIDCLYIQIHIGSILLDEIAKIRSLKIIIANIIKLSDPNDPVIMPLITARTDASAYTEDEYYNMIPAATQALSAILGGVDRLVITPSDSFISDPKPLNRRIARNVQHLLKMESLTDRVADPAGGSYYLDQMTNLFVADAWSQLQSPQ